MGYLFGSALPASVNYIFDFAFVAAFIGMLVPMIKDFSVVVTVIVSGIISILGAKFIPGKWYIIIACLVASFAGYAVMQIINHNAVEVAYKAKFEEVVKHEE